MAGFDHREVVTKEYEFINPVTLFIPETGLHIKAHNLTIKICEHRDLQHITFQCTDQEVRLYGTKFSFGNYDTDGHFNIKGYGTDAKWEIVSVMANVRGCMVQCMRSY